MDPKLLLAAIGLVVATSCAAPADDDDEPARDVAQASAAAAKPVLTTPLKDGAHFSSKITHPYFPLATVRYAEMRSHDELVVREVLAETRTIAGVDCTVLAEKEHEQGEVKEISYNFFAQDDAGNVYYFGEDVDDYEDGKVVSHGGAWLVGKNATEPCMFMPAHPAVGFAFKAENSPPAAEEFDEVDALDASLTVPAGTYRDVLVIKEADQPGKWKERKYYAKGVGLISENRELNLVKVR